MAPWELLTRSHRTPYLVCVRRVLRPNRVAVYRVPLQSRPPRISIPLRWNDREESLDLQTLVETAYANGRYDDIDYRAEPDPPLEPVDVAWADGLLRQAGRR